ncbi:hypothetical protein F4859DRAFT_509972 [Xylaria cf. heliscus]|nr:hypothetical protein F4859DRAFT_509972 [Xylaria cf. heliscus]
MSSHGPPRISYRAPRPIHRGGGSPGTISARRGGSWTTPKRVIWTGAFAAITIVGAIYGAGLKTQQEYQTEKKQVLEAPVEDRIAILEARRAQLVAQRRPLERKLEGLRLRVQKEKEKETSETRS